MFREKRSTNMRDNIRTLCLWTILFVSFTLVVLVPTSAQQTTGRFNLSADGMTVHDNLLHVTWLADSNLPAKQKYGLPIQQSGAMTFANARKWVAAINAAGYLGHRNWTLPAAPATDPDCSVAKGPHGNS